MSDAGCDIQYIYIYIYCAIVIQNNSNSNTNIILIIIIRIITIMTIIKIFVILIIIIITLEDPLRSPARQHIAKNTSAPHLPVQKRSSSRHWIRPAAKLLLSFDHLYRA